MLTGEAILQCDDLARERVKVPEWGGGELYARSMRGDELAALHKLLREDEAAGRDLVMARMVCACACGADGELLFKPGQAEAVARKNGLALTRVFLVAERLNPLSVEGMEEMRKNS